MKKIYIEYSYFFKLSYALLLYGALLVGAHFAGAEITGWAYAVGITFCLVISRMVRIVRIIERKE